LIIERMASELDIETAFIVNVANRSRRYYRVFGIPKRSGGTRTVFHPSPVLKTFQYWLTRNVFAHVPVSDAAVAYRKGNSIKRNAEIHLGSKHLLHLDIKDFFPSIRGNMLGRVIRDNHVRLNLVVDEKDERVINGLCLLTDHLVIGSVCAPAISNAVMYRFDGAAQQLTGSQGMKYTRYADDMVFSSNAFIEPSIVDRVELLLKEEGFELNRDKTFFMGNRGRKTVTGIVINAGYPSIGRTRKESIKTLLYRKLRYNEGDSAVILGHMSFLRDVEPDTFNSYVAKYGRLFNANVMETLIEERRQSIEPAKSEVASTKAN